MTLNQWITAGHGTNRQIAEAAGVHYATAWKWARGIKRPSWEHIPAIERATGGMVTAADFVPAPAESLVEIEAKLARFHGELQ